MEGRRSLDLTRLDALVSIIVNKKPAPDPTAAFPDADATPNDRDLAKTLGTAFAPLEKVFAWVAKTHPEATVNWQYSGQAGWYRMAVLKKRRLFYLVPKQGNFRLSLILGGKAIESLKSGKRSAQIATLLKTAKKYPEGTALDFDSASCDAALIADLITAKLEH